VPVSCVVHGVHGVQVVVACAVGWGAGVRGARAKRVHVPSWSRSGGCQAMGIVGVTDGWIRVCADGRVWLRDWNHGSEIGSRRQVGGRVVCLRVGLDRHTRVGVTSSTMVGDRLRRVGSVGLGARIRTSAMAGVVCGHWRGESTGCGGVAGRLDREKN
jgi:hypothetical protein